MVRSTSRRTAATSSLPENGGEDSDMDSVLPSPSSFDDSNDGGVSLNQDMDFDAGSPFDFSNETLGANTHATAPLPFPSSFDNFAVDNTGYGTGNSENRSSSNTPTFSTPANVLPPAVSLGDNLPVLPFTSRGYDFINEHLGSFNMTPGSIFGAPYEGFINQGGNIVSPSGFTPKTFISTYPVAASRNPYEDFPGSNMGSTFGLGSDNLTGINDGSPLGNLHGHQNVPEDNSVLPYINLNGAQGSTRDPLFVHSDGRYGGPYSGATEQPWDAQVPNYFHASGLLQSNPFDLFRTEGITGSEGGYLGLGDLGTSQELAGRNDANNNMDDFGGLLGDGNGYAGGELQPDVRSNGSFQGLASSSPRLSPPDTSLPPGVLKQHLFRDPTPPSYGPSLALSSSLLAQHQNSQPDTDPVLPADRQDQQVVPFSQSMQQQQQQGSHSSALVLPGHRSVLDQDICAKCFGAVNDSNIVCTGCYALRYCSPSCRTADWASHKNVCQVASHVGVGTSSIFENRMLAMAKRGETDANSPDFRRHRSALNINNNLQQARINDGQPRRIAPLRRSRLISVPSHDLTPPWNTALGRVKLIVYELGMYRLFLHFSLQKVSMLSPALIGKRYYMPLTYRSFSALRNYKLLTYF
jgi:hypothetical protein